MELTVHRGARQIGGCAVSIRTDKARIIIDMGEELDNDDRLPQRLRIEGVTCGERDCDAVFFTHYHSDHIGLCADIPDGIPMYMGEAAREIYSVLQKRLSHCFPEAAGRLASAERIRTFRALDRITAGDITVTPIMADHSAYDAYMFLIEAEGKKILHTGDFRTHGFRGKGVIKAAQTYVGQVDYLITEGTTLSREDIVPETERELSLKLRGYLNEYKYVFVLCSSTNIDRFAAINAALRGSRRWLFTDSYQKQVLDVATKYGGRFSPIYDFSGVKTYNPAFDESMRRFGFVMGVRANERFRGIMERFDSERSILLYSMWKGYIGHNEQLDAFLKDRRWEYFHTSGHASQQAIRELAQAVSPRCGIIPIHTELPEKAAEVCAGYKVILPQDGKAILL